MWVDRKRWSSRITKTGVVAGSIFFMMAGAVLSPAVAEEQQDASKPVETTSDDPNAPRIVHYPKFTVLRGVPFDVESNIEAAEGFVITQTVVQVKVTDLGYPTDYKLDPSEEGEDNFAGVIPFTFFSEISVFWYSITAYDSEGRLNSTIWIRVVILDPASRNIKMEAGGPVGGSGGGDPEAAAVVLGSGGGEKTGIIVGGILLAGGTALIVDNQVNKKKEPRDIPERETESTGGGGGDPETSPPTNNTNVNGCVTTGDESAELFDELYWCELKDPQPTRILVCGTCPDATIMAMGSWGAMDTIVNYNNDSCSTDGPYLVLEDPDGGFNQLSRTTPNRLRGPGASGGGTLLIESETITVYANGVQIAQFPWPPSSDIECFF